MALVKCPECKKKISDQCENCPNCGYPVNKIGEINENQTTNIDNVDESIKAKKSFDIKSLIKKWWFWVTVGVVIAAITTTTILLLNRDTKPKFDKDDNPIFVDFSHQVYTNPRNYLKQLTKIKGRIVNIIASGAFDNLIEVKLFPTSLGDTILIHYNNLFDDTYFNCGDYIICSGYIDSVNIEHKIVLISKDIQKSNYIDIVDPPLTTTILENITQTKLGCTISIEKIEHTPFETRIFISASNSTNTNVSLGIRYSTITQQTTQKHYFKDNIDANYNIPFSIEANQTIEGIIPFEPLQSGFECEFSLEASSNMETDNFIFCFDPY